MATASKPERSISPESNDSISEELNHFKPIVCSPCTPPKRLPDGRFLEPTVVKSTPRNLSRGLQKPTSYEASPTILQKWRQIETDRRLSRVASRGTATSPALEERRRGRACPDVAGAEPGEREKGRPCNKRRLIFQQQPPAGEHGPPVKRLAKAQTPPSFGEESDVADAADGGGAVSRERQILFLYSKRADGLQCAHKPLEAPEQRVNSSSKNSLRSRPSSRRGKKKNQKTKHLEGAGRARGGAYDGEREGERLYEGRGQQEREDRELALKLQRQFNMERRREDRRRATPDKYLLRSWAFPDGPAAYSPRRSVRISKKS